eukprot:TRINITY_DN39608_c0_g1_i1.p1 TRINITY_DN39608_c0_g1~~TRINITY_DN39608_c0_g1_i1.p1  ORF type:complete len:264 (+),score=47.75 TRINITY_DN39608_c0_g1_i1:682-1473(+)
MLDETPLPPARHQNYFDLSGSRCSGANNDLGCPSGRQFSEEVSDVSVADMVLQASPELARCQAADVSPADLWPHGGRARTGICERGNANLSLAGGKVFEDMQGSLTADDNASDAQVTCGLPCEASKSNHANLSLLIQHTKDDDELLQTHVKLHGDRPADGEGDDAWFFHRPRLQSSTVNNDVLSVIEEMADFEKALSNRPGWDFNGDDKNVFQPWLWPAPGLDPLSSRPTILNLIDEMADFEEAVRRRADLHSNRQGHDKSVR